MTRCATCPFGLTDASEDAINLGCLPDGAEILRMRKNGRTWACHDNQRTPCRGALEELQARGLPSSVALPLVTLADDYSKLVQP